MQNTKFDVSVIKNRIIEIRVIILLAIILITMSIPGQYTQPNEVSAQTGTTYYISSSSGNNLNSGISISDPWGNFDNLKNKVLNPGDRVLLKRGDIWNTRLTMSANGTENNPVYVGPYGDINKNAPTISLSNDRDDICIVVQDLININPYNVGLKYIHIDNLQLKNSRIGIFFRGAVSQENRGIKVTDCYFENMNCEPVMTAMLNKDNVQNELNMGKGNLDIFLGRYHETGGGVAEYVWPSAIMIGGRRGYPESMIGFSDIEIHNNVFAQCINGVLAYYYNLPSETDFFKNMNMSNCQITGTVNGILAIKGMDAGNPSMNENSRWGVFKNLNVISGHETMSFALGVTGLIIEDFANALFTDSSFNGVRNNGKADGCGFDFESRTRNITINKSIFAQNQGQGILIMDNGSGPHENITIRDSLFYNNLQSVTGDGYKWDITIWNKGNTDIRLINNHHISKVYTSGSHANRINSDGKISIFEGPRSFGSSTDGTSEENATFRRNDNLPNFNESVVEKNLQNSLKTVKIIQKTNEIEQSPTISPVAQNTPVPTLPVQSSQNNSLNDSSSEESGSQSETSSTEMSNSLDLSESLTSEDTISDFSEDKTSVDIVSQVSTYNISGAKNDNFESEKIPVAYVIVLIIFLGAVAFGLTYLVSKGSRNASGKK